VVEAVTKSANKPSEKVLQEPKSLRRTRGVFEHQRRQRDSHSGHSASSSPTLMPSVVGAAIIGICILLSTLIAAVGTRYIGFEGPSDETAWLVDRLTGNVYKCRAADTGKASCEEPTTGSVNPAKR
jgi:hypothetical protein